MENKLTPRHFGHLPDGDIISRAVQRSGSIKKDIKRHRKELIRILSKKRPCSRDLEQLDELADWYARLTEIRNEIGDHKV